MPGFNRKGPMGQGPMTGRKMGRCTNFGSDPKNQASSPNQTGEYFPANYRGRGMGYGRNRGGKGLGMGWRNRPDDHF